MKGPTRGDGQTGLTCKGEWDCLVALLRQVVDNLEDLLVAVSELLLVVVVANDESLKKKKKLELERGQTERKASCTIFGSLLCTSETPIRP